MSAVSFNFRDELSEEVGRIFFHFLETFDTKKIFNPKFSEETNFKEQIFLLESIFASTIYINFENIIQFSDELADILEEQFQRLDFYISDSITEFINKYSHQKKIYIKRKNQKNWVAFYNLPMLTSLSSLNSKNLNKLCCISGIVTRTSQPFPRLVYGSFKCENYGCSFSLNYVEQFLEFNEPKLCPKCLENNTWTLIFEESYFVENQKIKIQEFETEIFRKNVPKTLEIILREEFVNTVKPGDKCFFSGFLTTVPGKIKIINHEENIYSRALNSEINSPFYDHISVNTHFKLCFISNHLFFSNFHYKKKNFGFIKSKDTFFKEFFFSREEKEKILKIRSKKKLINVLTKSLIPGFKGLENLKIGILLLLVGGTKKKTIENIRLRGNINLCLMSNLQHEKNQILQNLSEYFAKTIFVSGKNCSSAGLTASILRDEESKNFSIQAGALMLSDNGVCFIDNINKLKPQNLSFLHESLEHQTISLAKANVRTTINSRSSIFATIEMEKKYYDKKKSIHKNSGMNLTIFSRFDLFFLILDNPKKNFDFVFSKILLDFNQKNKNHEMKKNFARSVGLYLSFAKLVNPAIKQGSKILLVRIYKYLRKCQFLENLKTNYFTIRQLESLIRLSEAFSKLYLCKYVKKFHVKAAAKLLFSSLYPFNDYSIRGFTEFFKKLSFSSQKKIEYKEKYVQKKLGFREFQIFFKFIIFQILKQKNKIYTGVSLLFIFRKIMKSNNYIFSFRQKQNHVKKIFLVLKYMIFSYRNLLSIKQLKTRKKNKILRRVVFLRKIRA